MLTALDHIIIGVHDLQKATNIFSEKLGLAVSGGGNHPSGGTANRIIVIGDTYIELIAVREPEEAQQSMLNRLAIGDGYLNFALASDDIRADTAAMQSRKISALGPDQGQLTDEQGRSRGWSRTSIERPDLAQPYPFLIQHDSTGEERRSRLAGWTTPPQHPLGALKVLSATMVVEDLQEARSRFHRIYGLEASPAFYGSRDGWDAELVSFILRGPSGEQQFELAAPLPLFISRGVDESLQTPELLTEPGALEQYLRIHGEGLCRIALSVESLERARAYLDEHQVVYTFIDSKPLLWIHPTQSCGATIVLHEQPQEITFVVTE